MQQFLTKRVGPLFITPWLVNVSPEQVSQRTLLQVGPKAGRHQLLQIEAALQALTPPWNMLLKMHAEFSMQCVAKKVVCSVGRLTKRTLWYLVPFAKKVAST